MLKEQLLILYSTPVYLIAILLELSLSHFRFKKNVYTFKDTIQNAALNLTNFGVDSLCRLFYLAVLLFAAKQWVIFEWPQQGVLYWGILLLAVDFVFYWLHRMDHEVRLFWAVHVTHHNSEEFNFTTGFRSSVFEPIYRFVFFIPLVLFGFEPLHILFVFSLTQIWGTFVHTKLVGKLGWLEYIFVTPSHHRVHHASNAKYLDKNMGMFLIIWDRMFGTFQEELPETDYEPLQYGVTSKPDCSKLGSIIFHEWADLVRDLSQKGISAKHRLKYIFGRPGYSHDGSKNQQCGNRTSVPEKQDAMDCKHL